MLELIITVSPLAGKVPPKLAAVQVVPVDVRMTASETLPRSKKADSNAMIPEILKIGFTRFTIDFILFKQGIFRGTKKKKQNAICKAIVWKRNSKNQNKISFSDDI
jgi:hypothetical protein